MFPRGSTCSPFVGFVSNASWRGDDFSFYTSLKGLKIEIIPAFGEREWSLLSTPSRESCCLVFSYQVDIFWVNGASPSCPIYDWTFRAADWTEGMSEGHLLWSIRIWVLSRLGKRRDLRYSLVCGMQCFFKCLLASYRWRGWRFCSFVLGARVWCVSPDVSPKGVDRQGCILHEIEMGNRILALVSLSVCL